MKAMAVETLAQYVGGTLTGTGQVSRIGTDSRTTRAGDCFFAIRGQRFDGHDYAAQAASNGASCLVIDRPIQGPLPCRTAVIQVKDTVKALGDLARAYRLEAGFRVVAVTGSVGKTTTKHIIAHLACRALRGHQSPGNFNNQIGLPLAILQAEPDQQLLVLELGTNSPGEIAYLSSIAVPDVAVLTGVWPAHLQGLGDMERLTAEKLSITRYLDRNGAFVVNADQPDLLERATKLHPKVIGFGLSSRAQVRPTDVQMLPDGTRYQLDSVQMYLPLPGSGNLSNALAATAACMQLGMGLDQIAGAISTVRPVDMRGQVCRLGPVTVIVDCYNASPASMANALELLEILASPGQRRVFVCGDMAELGGGSEYYHRQLGLRIRRAKVELLVAVGQWSRTVADAACGQPTPMQAACFPDAVEACKDIANLVKAGDIVLVKGSRTIGLERVVQALSRTFGQCLRADGVNGFQG